METEITGWHCVTLCEHETSESAWKEYIENFKHLCVWLRGYKYWRVKPELNSQIDFESGKTLFRVYSRFILSKNEIHSDEIEPASFTHNEIKYEWSSYGF